MSASSFVIPRPAWRRRFDARPPQKGRPSKLSLRAFPLRKMPFILARMAQDARRRRQAHWDSDDIILTASSRRAPGPHQGVPLGGIGVAALGRGWRGEFRRWQRRPGIYHHGVVWADQFSLFAHRPGQPSQVRVLSAAQPEDGTLAAWRWGMNPACATYHALFPRAWTVYEEPLPGLRLTCRQLSPVIPHNYSESSLPTGHLLWLLENLADTEVTVGLMFTWQNGMGTENDLAGGHANRPFRLVRDGQVLGVALQHVQRQPRSYPLGQSPGRQQEFEMPLTFAIASRAGDGVGVTYCSRFQANGDGGAVWSNFAHNGYLGNTEDSRPAAPGEAIAAALAATVTIPPGGRQEIPFALSWDAPLVRSGFGTAYHPRYTRFYGHEGNAAPAIAGDTLAHADAWEAKVQAWQQPILEDPGLPQWYKMALFNELYYLVDGGTWWVYPSDPTQPVAETEVQDHDDDLGHFAYLEGHEYRMINTYDVHFYASFALAMLWPELELSLQRDVAAATLDEIQQSFTPVWSGQPAQRKVSGAVPHDLGWPDEDPWHLVNGYFLHDPNRWKDLNAKFVLQVYRDYVATGDASFVAQTWPAVEAAIGYAARFDRDGDGLIENDGYPDQTYDTWSVLGPSAYTGGLWLAALAAAAALADLLNKPSTAAQLRAILAQGQAAYQAKLWNGRYFNYDSSRNQHNDSIMADQLAGHWYARACSLPDIIQPNQARSSLQTIYDFNVRGFGAGQLGAVNGMRPDGRVDTTSMQSQEVWPGTTYALAATMLQEGMVEEAFNTAEGVVRTTYETRGYWFQTPEAWDKNGNYRSIAYMRPLAIWAMQWAWEQLQPPASRQT